MWLVILTIVENEGYSEITQSYTLKGNSASQRCCYYMPLMGSAIGLQRTNSSSCDNLECPRWSFRKPFKWNFSYICDTSLCICRVFCTLSYWKDYKLKLLFETHCTLAQQNMIAVSTSQNELTTKQVAYSGMC